MKNKNYDLLFEDPEKESIKWDDTCFDLGYQMNNKELVTHFQTANEIYMDEYQVMSCIAHLFSEDENAETRERLISGLKESKRFKKVKIKENEISVKLGRTNINARSISELFPKFADLDGHIQFLKKSGNCHWGSLRLSGYLQKAHKLPNRIVTGNMYGMSDKAKYLHSWLETELNGEEVVFDYTLNAVINKEGYYAMRHAEPLSTIESGIIKNDVKSFDLLFNEIGIKGYLLFRDEIMKDFKKNNISADELSQ